MKTIDQIDPNFRIPDAVPENYVYYDPRNAPFRLWGLCPNSEGSYCRLPPNLLPQCSEGVRHLSRHTAGGILRFSTDADGLCVLWTLMDQTNMPHKAATGQSGMELYEETDLGSRQIKTVIPQMENGMGCRKRQSAFVPLPGGTRHYALYLPLYNGLDDFMLGLPPAARLEAGRTPRVEKPLVFYGSSITQGGCACKTGACYTAILTRRLDAAHVNLGFSGNARGETVIAEYIASLEMSAFILDYDHNAPSVEHLAATHEAFYRVIREAQPDLPIVMASKPDFDADPRFAAQRREIVMQTYLNALRGGDRRVAFVDGQLMFGNRDRDLCTVDGTHPTNLGFLRMADAFEAPLRALMGLSL